MKRAWAEMISVADYEAHMARVGQAQANADLVRSIIGRFPSPGPTLLFAGAGTGQMFDYVDASFLDEYRVVFTDISETFLNRLAERLSQYDHQRTVDDLEDTKLAGPFDGAVVVLVLEHIDWRKGIASLAKLKVKRCYIVIQENPEEPAASFLQGTMAVLSQARASLVPEKELMQAMRQRSYRLVARESRDVPDNKKMIAMIFDLSD